jgi:hypothetical protein
MLVIAEAWCPDGIVACGVRPHCGGRGTTLRSWAATTIPTSWTSFSPWNRPCVQSRCSTRTNCAHHSFFGASRSLGAASPCCADFQGQLSDGGDMA